ncbi:BfmA/BtgA family mobilization protein [Apibacter adventoris]|uniref:Clindamycin resistance transfer factor BtgA n=1 Tax=Apibacter adventoris TaxID=1679466 RepID=A0A2S8AEA8_9FLAO|nr:BfmA/BtgA family mobilization protein [Apibacter adventoris]PQL93440.1 clindamycin resistance transfer factor BtgA [Apibacter adventoris]
MANQHRKTIFTTIAIDSETNKLVEKICKRYSLKKGEVVKLAFVYLDKASINPSETPESTKAELRKINKRQDDLIRFIRHYEEEQLNPMIRTSHSITTKFDTISKGLVDSLAENIQDNRNILAKLSEVIGNSFKSQNDVLNNHANAINSLSKIFKQGNKKIEQIIYLYIELSNCGVMDSKKKENLKSQITNLINSQ